MDSKSFKSLLLDLYDVYNTSKKKDVDRIVESYNGREFDAVKTVLIRYNYKGHPGYNENAVRDDYVSYLIKSYENGESPLSKENRLKESQAEEERRLLEIELENKNKEQKKQEILNLGEETKSAITQEVSKLKSEMERQLKSKMDEINNYFQKKKAEFDKRESYIKGVESNVLEFSGITSTEIVHEVQKSHTRINIDNLNFSDSDIQLPKEDILDSLTKGTKLILKNSEGRVCGVEVKDITYDLVSYEDEVIKEIILERI